MGGRAIIYFGQKSTNKNPRTISARANAGLGGVI